MVASAMQDKAYPIGKHDDMVKIGTQPLSPVNQMYEGRSVFITGASGFIGRVLLEKLLYCYQGIRRIYVLMRAKKNVQPIERLNKQVLRAPIFDRIRALKNGQELLDKIVVVTGDIGEEQLGLSEADLNMMLADPTLGIVFHSAATVKFDEPLNTSIKFNLTATQTVIEICKRLPNLVALCHVSTAYVNSDQKNNQIIEEKLYPMQQSPQKMIELSKLMDDELMQQIKPALLGERPNTYTYTKALGEHLLSLTASDLPVAIVRPSIVVASWREPFAGWIDNLNGPTGLILAVGKGLLRSMHTRIDCKADVIPVDIVINTMIAASYYAAKTSGKLPQELPPTIVNEFIDKKDEKNEETCQLDNGQQNTYEKETNSKKTKELTRVPPIFHCVSGDINPITWGKIETLFFPVVRAYPSIEVLRYPFGTFKSNKYHDMITRLFVHFLPALIIDMICSLMGKKRQLVSIYMKLHTAIAALSHFTTNNYNFQSRNIKLLQESLTHPLDREELFMDISSLHWYDFWSAYVLGARRHVLKEDDRTLEQARHNFRRALYLEYAFRTLLAIFAVLIAAPIIKGALPSLQAIINPSARTTW